MSTHECAVVKIKMEPHPNADSLSLVRIDGYTVCVRTSDWQDGQLAVYVEPDYVVDSNLPQFKFLGYKTKYNEDDSKEEIFVGGPQRIKVKKLRGVISHGLLVPAPEGAVVGENYMEKWGIQRYEPPEPTETGGELTGAPRMFVPKYDVESFRKYNRVFREGEEVVITEKIHGSNARFIFSNSKDDPKYRMFAGSRSTWKEYNPFNMWWKALGKYPQIKSWCESHPDLTLFGEVFGHQDLKYGAKQGEVFFRAFDILTMDGWASWENSQELIKRGVDKDNPIPWVPVIYRGPFSLKLAEELAQQESMIPGANHLREGIVIKPVIERVDHRAGRVQLKLVSDRYLSR